MFNYNSRTFSIIAILFLIFLGYKTMQSNTSTSTSEELTAGIPGRYNIEINPNKPDSELALGERVMLYIFGDKLKGVANKKEVVDSQIIQNTSVEHLLKVIKSGDKVQLTLTDISNPSASSDPILLVVGEAMQGKEIDDAIIGLKVGDIRLIELHNRKHHIKILSINPVENSIKPQGQ